jgi:hypothetical protein
MPKLPTAEEEAAAITRLLETVHYYPPNTTPLDEYGLPYVAPEPDDPDDDEF